MERRIKSGWSRRLGYALCAFILGSAWGMATVHADDPMPQALIGTYRLEEAALGLCDPVLRAFVLPNLSGNQVDLSVGGYYFPHVGEGPLTETNEFETVQYETKVLTNGLDYQETAKTAANGEVTHTHIVVKLFDGGKLSLWQHSDAGGPSTVGCIYRRTGSNPDLWF